MEIDDVWTVTVLFLVISIFSGGSFWIGNKMGHSQERKELYFYLKHEIENAYYEGYDDGYKGKVNNE